ncbi:hypothetical protein ACU4GR_32605 (plasmid) [Methylobacterium oryzae CBMB20]
MHDEVKGRPFVLHEPNPASEGPSVEIELGSFLVAGGGGPEHLELLRLIGTLAKEAPAADGASHLAKPEEPIHSKWVPASHVS